MYNTFEISNTYAFFSRELAIFSSAVGSLQSFGYEPEVDPEKLKDPIDIEFSVSSDELEDSVNSVSLDNSPAASSVHPDEPDFEEGSPNSEGPVLQEVLSSATVSASLSAQVRV